MDEYIALSSLKERGYELISTEPILYCKAFKDNSGALGIFRLPNMLPRTKAINASYHQFQKYVRLGTINIYPITTHDQVANMFTKPLTQNTFAKHRNEVCGSYISPCLVLMGVWDNKKWKWVKVVSCVFFYCMCCS